MSVAGFPATTTEKVAGEPAVTDTLAGWVVITGPEATVKIAAELVALGKVPLEATTSYSYPFIEAVVEAVV